MCSIIKAFAAVFILIKRDVNGGNKLRMLDLEMPITNTYQPVNAKLALMSIRAIVNGLKNL